MGEIGDVAPVGQEDVLPGDLVAPTPLPELIEGENLRFSASFSRDGEERETVIIVLGAPDGFQAVRDVAAMTKAENLLNLAYAVDPGRFAQEFPEYGPVDGDDD